MNNEDTRTDYKLMQRLFNILGIEHEDKEKEDRKLILIKNVVNAAILFVFDKNGVYKYMA